MLINRMILRLNGSILDESYGSDITITAQFKVGDLMQFQESLLQFSNGSLQAVIVETKDVILPIE